MDMYQTLSMLLGRSPKIAGIANVTADLNFQKDKTLLSRSFLDESVVCEAFFIIQFQNIDTMFIPT